MKCKGKKRCRSVAGYGRLCKRHNNSKNGFTVYSEEYIRMISSLKKLQNTCKRYVRKIIERKNSERIQLWRDQHLQYRKDYLSYFIDNGCKIPKFECNICYITHKQRMKSCINNKVSFQCGHVICRSCSIQMANNGMNFCPLCRGKGNVGLELVCMSDSKYVVMMVNDLFTPYMNKKIYINNDVRLVDGEKPTYEWSYGSSLAKTSILSTKNVICYTHLINDRYEEYAFIREKSTMDNFRVMYMAGLFIDDVDNQLESYPTIYVKTDPSTKRTICAFSVEDDGEMYASEEQSEMFNKLFGGSAHLIETDYGSLIVDDEEEDYTYNCYITSLWHPLNIDTQFYYSSIDEIGEKLNKDTLPFICKIRSEDGYMSKTDYVDDLQIMMNIIVNTTRYREIIPKDIETVWSTEDQTLYMQNEDISACAILNETVMNTDIKWVDKLPIIDF